MAAQPSLRPPSRCGRSSRHTLTSMRSGRSGSVFTPGRSSPASSVPRSSPTTSGATRSTSPAASSRPQSRTASTCPARLADAAPERLRARTPGQVDLKGKGSDRDVLPRRAPVLGRARARAWARTPAWARVPARRWRAPGRQDRFDRCRGIGFRHRPDDDLPDAAFGVDEELRRQREDAVQVKEVAGDVRRRSCTRGRTAPRSRGRPGRSAGPGSRRRPGRDRGSAGRACGSSASRTGRAGTSSPRS